MHRLRSNWLVGFLVVLCVTRALADNQEWGDLSGRFVYDGETPKAKALTITSDKEAFTEPIFDESFMVHPKTRGLANVVVYLLPKDGAVTPVHSSYEKTAKANIHLLMKGGRFEPHMLLLRMTQIMTLENCDMVAHNPKTAFGSNAPL